MSDVSDLLRSVTEVGIGLEPNNGLLRCVGKTSLPPHLVAMVKAHRQDLLHGLSDGVLRLQWPSLPSGSFPVMWRPLLAWYWLEKTSFSAEEEELYQERAAVREYDGGAARWWAEVSAIEDIVNQRLNRSSSSTLTRAA